MTVTSHRHAPVLVCVAAPLLMFFSTGCTAAPAGEGPEFKTATTIAPLVRRQFCTDRPFYQIKVLKDAGGAIGGYVLQPAIRDSPIPYLDHEGNPLTSFHIFGSDEEKRNAMALIKPLLKRFPLQEPLDCNPPAS